MSTESDLLTMCGPGFSSTARTGAIVVANKYFGTSDGDSDGDDLGTAMLAMAVMLNERRASKGKTDPSVAVVTIDQLVTPEMTALITKNSASTRKIIINYQQPSGSYRRG